MSPRLDAHYQMVLRALVDGRVVPLLGAGVNRCGRPDGVAWDPGRYLPDGKELADHLASYAKFPEPNRADLVRVSQYFAVVLGDGSLYDELRVLFNLDYPPTPIHTFFAELPDALRRRDLPAHRRLIVTTNYDDALERAFLAAGEPFDLVTYVAVGDHAGRFLHYAPDREPVLIEKPNEYRDLSLDKRTVILKLHGAVDRRDAENDSYVITEDHYIDYLTRTELSLLPVELARKLRRSHFLFLGYSLRDWNLRVILHRIWGEQRGRRYHSWAVQRATTEIDRCFWEARKVDIFEVDLKKYVGSLSAGLEELSTSLTP